MFLHADKDNIYLKEFKDVPAGELWGNLYSFFVFNVPESMSGVRSPAQELEEAVGGLIMVFLYTWVLYVAVNPVLQQHSSWSVWEQVMGVQDDRSLNWPKKSLSALGRLGTRSPLPSPLFRTPNQSKLRLKHMVLFAGQASSFTQRLWGCKKHFDMMKLWFSLKGDLLSPKNTLPCVLQQLLLEKFEAQQTLIRTEFIAWVRLPPSPDFLMSLGLGGGGGRMSRNSCSSGCSGGGTCISGTKT